MYFKLKDRVIGSDYSPLVIPEIGINHEGDIEKAKLMIREASAAGAEVVKFQCHIPDAEMVEEAKQIIPINDTRSIYEIMQKCSFAEEQERELKEYTELFGMVYLSTPFSREAVDRLERLGVCAYKVGSGECNNKPLIEYIASKKKPVILSTGMNNLSTVVESASILSRNKISYALMHCVSIYPTPWDKVNLGALRELKNFFPGVPIGLSDHSVGNYTAFAAIALGASIVEKHFTVSKYWSGPDISLSIDPAELCDLVKGSRAIYCARHGSKMILRGEVPTIKFAYASVFAFKDLEPGDVLTKENIWVARPGTGDFLATDYYKLLGNKVVKKVEKGKLLRKTDIDLK